MAEDLADIPGSLKDFLEDEVVCCLAVAMPDDQVHVAPLRFWCDVRDLCVYMTTSRASEKMWWLREGKLFVNASVAIGVTRKLPYSLQMRGTLEIFDPNADTYVAEQYSKIASELDNIYDPSNTMIKFCPTWARYTDRATEQKLMYSIDLIHLNVKT